MLVMCRSRKQLGQWKKTTRAVEAVEFSLHFRQLTGAVECELKSSTGGVLCCRGLSDEGSEASDVTIISLRSRRHAISLPGVVRLSE